MILDTCYMILLACALALSIFIIIKDYDKKLVIAEIVLDVVATLLSIITNRYPNACLWGIIAVVYIAILFMSDKPLKIKIKIKYFDKEIDKIEKITQGDWIDLRSAEDIELKKGEYKLIPLGIAMKLPNGYEAHVAPRSSTYKNFKVLQSNSFGIIDNSYCSESDQWFFPAYATEKTVIHKNDRICQFRIVKSMPTVDIVEVEHLDDESRGGFGSTGIN